MAAFTREELLAEKARRDALREAKAPPGLPAASVSPYTREELMAEKAKRDAMRAQQPEPLSEQENEEGFSWPKFIMQQVGVGALSLPDLLTSIAKVTSKGGIPVMPSEVPEGAFGLEDIQERIRNQRPSTEEVGPETIEEFPLPSSIIPQTEEPETGLQRIAGHGARGLGAAITGGPANLLRNAAFTGSQGLLSGTAQEAGVNPLVADIASGIGVNRLASAGRSLVRGNIGGATDAEEAVGNYLQRTLGQKHTQEAIDALSSQLAYSKINYEPMTAEVAGAHNPLFPQLHRLRYETVGSGLPSKSAAQREAIADALEARTLNAASGPEIQAGLSAELKKRIAERRTITQPLYEQIDQATQPLNPRGTKQYLKKQVEAGDLERDRAFVKKAISSTEKLTPADKEYAKLYNSSSPSVRKQMEPPKTWPEARRVAAASRAVRSKIEKVKRSGEKQRQVKLSEALAEIEKDLDILPAHKEATEAYKLHSIPVNEIDKHPGLMKVIKSTANDVTDLIFDSSSKYNVQGLKKALSNNPVLMDEVRESSIRHMEHSIGNAGAQGAHNVLSYPKLRRYIDKHKDALSELYNPEQLEFLGELKQALHGQNIAKSLGKGEGSPTYSRLVSDMGVSKGLGIKSLESASHLIPTKLGGGPIRLLLNRYAQTREADVMSVLDRALREPAFARDLLRGQFRSQRGFNQYVNGVLRGSIVPVSESSRRNEDEEDE